MGTDRDDTGPSTKGVHAGSPEAAPGAPVVVPLYQSATFYGGSETDTEALRYSRYGNNPNQLVIAEKMAALEGTEAALMLSSGMAATAMTFLAVLPDGGHVVASRHLYGATEALLTEELAGRGVTVTYVEPDSRKSWLEAVRPETRALFLEVPTNPTLRVFDPRIPAEIGGEVGASLVVDATFASPVNIRAASLGADAVIHSATKYLGGHSDLIAGVVSGSGELIESVRARMKLYGPSPDPHAAWLLDRGLRTLALRMEVHNRNAMAVARWFEDQPSVSRVFYPGLESHPDHALAGELLTGFGGMVSVVFDGGARAADAFTARLKLAMVAPSLGGVETLVSQPRLTSHLHFSTDEREERGIPDGFVRLSIGVEDSSDLISDFSQALAGLQ